MASIALSVVGCIDYLAYGAIFTRVMFLPKKKVMFFWIFFPARKAQDVRREEVAHHPPKLCIYAYDPK
jgi:hypothetical protein